MLYKTCYFFAAFLVLFRNDASSLPVISGEGGSTGGGESQFMTTSSGNNGGGESYGTTSSGGGGNGGGEFLFETTSSSGGGDGGGEGTYITTSGNDGGGENNNGGGDNGEGDNNGGGDNGEGDNNGGGDNGEGDNNGGGYSTTTTSYQGFTDHVCEKNSEPSDSCSLLLQVTIQTQYAISVQNQIYNVFKEAWRWITHTGSYSYVSIDLYFEFLQFLVLNDKRRLQSEAINTTSASPASTIVVTTSPTTTSSPASTETVVVTTSSSYSYSYNFSIAFFDSDCDAISLWYQFFSALGQTFIDDFNDNAKTACTNYTSNGFGSTSITYVSLSERDSNGDVIAVKTFNVTSAAGNNYNNKYTTLLVGSLALVWGLLF